MTNIHGWQWLFALAIGLGFFIVFSAAYGLLVYLRPPKIVSEIKLQNYGFEAEEVRITTSDGLKLAAWFIPSSAKAAAGKPASNKAILLLHGYPADKGDIFSSTLFLREGYNLLYLDFRYFGQSQGSYSTIGMKEVEDVLAGVKYLRERGMSRIGIWGFSMGGATALMSLPRSTQIDAVVSDTAYASLELMASEVYRQVPYLNKIIARLMVWSAKLFLKLDPEQLSPLSAVLQTQKPIFLIHSRDDEVIPFAQAEMLKAASVQNPKAEFWFREGAQHGYLGSPEYNEKVRDFFKRHL